MTGESFYLNAPLGGLRIELRDGRLYSVSKTAESRHTEDQETGSLSVTAQRVKDQIEGYFLKKIRVFSVSLFDRGTPFQKAVWRELQKIPYGTTVTYRELAQKTGVPRGARAVGGACAKNPFLIVVPCHRVVAESHLGGFALGLPAKQFLLKEERTAVHG